MTSPDSSADSPPVAGGSTRVDVGSDVVRRFAERGEDALQRIAELPGGSRVLRGVSDLGRRVDEIGRRVRGVEELEQRIARLEQELTTLKENPAPSRPARKPSARNA